VIETLQLLLFTALVAWLLVDRIGPKSMITTDADWFYRRLPRVVAEVRLRRWSDDRPPVEGPASRGRRRSAPSPVPGPRCWSGSRTRPYEDPPPVSATWVLGAVVLGVAVLLLGLTLVTT
jgi:hypothetical protein